MSTDLLGSTEAGGAAVRGGLLRVAGYGLGLVLSVASAAVLFRHLGVADSGRYVLVLSLVTVAGGLTDAGLSTVGVRDLSATREVDRAQLLRNLLGLRIALTTIGVGAACAYAHFGGYGETLVLGTLLAGVGLLATNVQNALATVLIADLRLGWVTVVDGLRQAVTAAGIVLLALVGATLLPFFAVTAVAGAVALATTARLVRDGSARPGFDRARWSAMIRETLPFALAVAVGAVYFRLAIILVDALTGPRESGYFGASFRIVEVLVIVPQLAIGAVFPIFARAAVTDPARLRYAVQKTLDACLLLGTLVLVGLAVGAPFIVAVLAGPGFGPAADVLRLHALALAGAFAGAVFGYTLLSLHRYRAVLLVNAVALLTMAIAGAVLIPLYGARGGAAATAIAEASLAVTAAVALARSGAVAGVSWRVLPPLVIAAAAGIGVSAALGLPSLPAAVLAGVVCVGLALKLGAVPEELLVELRGVRSRRRPPAAGS